MSNKDKQYPFTAFMVELFSTIEVFNNTLEFCKKICPIQFYNNNPLAIKSWLVTLNCLDNFKKEGWIK